MTYAAPWWGHNCIFVSCPRAHVKINRNLDLLSSRRLPPASTALRRSVDIVTSEAYYPAATSLQRQQDLPDRDSTGFRPDGNRNNHKSRERSEARCRGCTCRKADAGCETDFGIEDEGLHPLLGLSWLTSTSPESSPFYQLSRRLRSRKRMPSKARQQYLCKQYVLLLRRIMVRGLIFVC